MEHTIKDILRSRYSRASIDVRAVEVGRGTLERWYRATSAPILVTDTFEVDAPGGYKLPGTGWEAYATAVPASWLYDLYQKHRKNLFSANLRDYLGSRKAEENINNGIKESAEHAPGNFWVYNNGITALVNDFETRDGGNSCLVVYGISIVNGAQTTGAIGSLPKRPAESAYVPARFVKCSNPELIHDIVKYNNSQNQMVPADFRSTDPIQVRLREEFSHEFSTLTYLGGRRGGAEDVIRRRPNLLASDTVAQAMAAFHQEPVLAYHRKRQLWQEPHYSKVFKGATHADHIIFVFTLHKAVTEMKASIMADERNGVPLTKANKEALEFLRNRGGMYMLMTAISESMEAIQDRPIPDSFALRFRRKLSVAEAEVVWQPILRAAIAASDPLAKPLVKRLVSMQDVLEAVRQFRRFIEATAESNRGIYAAFAAEVVSDRSGP